MITVVTEPKDIMRRLESGQRILCEWVGLNSYPGEVIRVEGTRVLIKYWETHWHLIDCEGLRLVAVEDDTPKRKTFEQWLKSQGIEWPNLGVNMPAGCDWVAASMMADALRLWKVSEMNHVVGDNFGFFWIEQQPQSGFKKV